MDPEKIYPVTEQVKDNCNISDARYGGNLSLCNMLLRLRQLYYNEHSLEPWEPCDNRKIIDWIDERENLWNKIEDQEISCIIVENETFDPFQSNLISGYFEKENLVYGAGIGMFGKPQFFLAKPIRIEIRENLKVHYLDNETCTDLLPSLAMSQENNIFIRKQILVSYLFYRFRDRKSGSLLEEVFGQYGLGQKTRKSSYKKSFGSLADSLYELIVMHESSEIKNRNEHWMSILTNGVPKNTEIFFRTMKDCISDLSDDGPLAYIVSEKKEELLYLYQAFFNHWQESFFPAFPGLIENFKKTGDFGVLESFREKYFSRLQKAYRNFAAQIKTEGIEKVNKMVLSLQKRPQDILSEI